MTENRTHSSRLEKIGKQLPYSVPDGFFENFNEQVAARALASDERKVKKLRLPAIAWRNIWHTTASAAAVAAIIIAFKSMAPDTMQAEPITIEQAFNNLSTEDQDTLLDTYRADLLFDY